MAKKQGKKGKNQSAISPMEIANIATEAVDSIINIIKCVGEERRKTEEIRLEGKRIVVDLEREISEQENETARILGQYQLEIEKLVKETRQVEIAAEKEMKEGQYRHEETLKRIEVDHERRMRQLDIIEKIVDAALNQYSNYATHAVIYNQDGTTTPIINIQLIEAMNTSIFRLRDTLAVACLDSPE